MLSKCPFCWSIPGLCRGGSSSKKLGMPRTTRTEQTITATSQLIPSQLIPSPFPGTSQLIPAEASGIGSRSGRYRHKVSRFPDFCCVDTTHLCGQTFATAQLQELLTNGFRELAARFSMIFRVCRPASVCATSKRHLHHCVFPISANCVVTSS